MSNVNAETYSKWWKKLKKSDFAKKNPNFFKGGGTRIHPGAKPKSSSNKGKKTTTRSMMEAKNRAIHGDKKIDALKIKTQKFKDNRAEMQRLRKNNPEEYKRRKKKQRRAENLAAFKAGSHTWD